VIYLDTSVVLAELLAEDQKPPRWIWDTSLLSSRLLEYETWTRLNARNLAGSHGEAARAILGRVSYVELTRDVLARALDPWPVGLRTLDALHLASLLYLRSERLEVSLATFDVRLREAAGPLAIPLTWA
jgi:predicted nucleic acid-binding protein